MQRTAKLLLTVSLCMPVSGCAMISLTKHEQVVKVTCDGVPTPESCEAADKCLAAAEQFLDRQDLLRAEKELKRAIELNCNLGAAHNNLGLVYFERRRLYDAAHSFNEAIRLLPHDPSAYNNLGLTLERADRRDEAILNYEQAYALSPHDPEILGNLVRARIARGDQTDDIETLLRELIFLETRPEWVEWARDELYLMRPIALRELDLGRRRQEDANHPTEAIPSQNTDRDALPANEEFFPTPAPSTPVPPLPAPPLPELPLGAIGEVRLPEAAEWELIGD